MKHGRLIPELVTNEEFPDIAINNSVRDAMLSGETLEKARDWTFMSPEAYARKWNNGQVADPEPDPLPAEQAESIANLGAGQGTDEIDPELQEPEEWQPRDMKTTVITRENIDHFNNPFA